MKRGLVLAGAWGAAIGIGAYCVAAQPGQSLTPQQQAQQQYQAALAAQQAAAQQAAAQRAAARQAASQQAAANAAAARQAAANAAAVQKAASASAAQTASANAAATNAQKNYQNNYTFYTYPYGYPPYGYGNSPYGSYPPGTTPYVVTYDSTTGNAYLTPYSGGYSPYNSYYGNPYYRNPYMGYGYPGAVFANPNQLYGPGPIQQLMGVGGWGQQPQANGNANQAGNGGAFANGNGINGNANQFPNANGGGGGNGNANGNAGLANNANAAGQDAVPPAPKPAPAGGKAMEIAWKFITYGDAHFGNGKYNDALDRYRNAAKECPKLADAWFREGFALAALGRYEAAATAMRRGLEEKPDWPDSNFHLTDIFGNDSSEKSARLDKMIKASETQPNNGDLAYVVGVHLFCDGKPEQAASFFRRAVQILGSDADMKAFLAKGQ